jgi:hypothetical protein
MMRRVAFAAMSSIHTVDRGLRGVSIYTGSRSDLVTSVFPLVAPALSELIGGLAAEFPEHYWYPPIDLHLSIAGLSEEAGIGDRLHEVLDDERPFTASLCGLAMSRESVYVRVYAGGRHLALLRRRLAIELGGRSRPLANLGHANIARFQSNNVAKLARRVRGLSKVRLGDVTLSTVLLARTDKVFSRNGTEVMREIHLRA